MGKHRHQQRYRRTVVTAVAVGVIGIPSVAMACTDWPGDEQRQDHRTAAGAAGDRWDGPDWYSRWSSQQHGEPSAVPSDTPAASPSKPGTAKGEGAKPSHKPKPPTASAAKPTTAAPKPTTAAPKPKPTPTTAAPKPTTAAPGPTATAPAPSGAVAQVVELVNAERGKVGCSPVKVNSTLTKAAQDHSEDMAATGTMSHSGSDGSSPGDRITRAGYAWSTYGENVAYGYSTPEQVMDGWMNSPGHKANILNCAFKEIGVGLAQPGGYWTQDFGTAR
ncbi:CAP domain-containing protein [Streptomyces edwardsiae]|uniref:CAP domain-containing protein n=1 Tax=Streptomyces edwardsiae TaxID=3075527 RepID=A0ABU2QNT6_9ACTN|nr:CAP domain-containing protein [Streptomyces sp. DSM 41635]MDT0405691.1 CAP domain-containing protein [Streptomyces sp. DSM 41635]